MIGRYLAVMAIGYVLGACSVMGVILIACDRKVRRTRPWDEK